MNSLCNLLNSNLDHSSISPRYGSPKEFRYQDRSIELNRSKSVKSILNKNIQKDRLNKLKNKFKSSLDRLNKNETKAIAFKELKEMIKSNINQEGLRIFIELLSIYHQSLSVSSKELQALLIGFLAFNFKENLVDPIDKPCNIVRTVKKLVDTLHVYLSDSSFVVHKSVSHSLQELFKNSMPKEDISASSIIFVEPLVYNLISGSNSNLQNGCAVCLNDMIGMLLETEQSNVVSLNFDGIIRMISKTLNDSIYLFSLLFTLVNSIEINLFAEHLRDLYAKCISGVGSADRDYMKKIVIMDILRVLAMKLKNKVENLVGYFNPDVFDLISDLTKDRVHKVQKAAQDSLKEWQQLKKIHEQIEKKKMQKEESSLHSDGRNKFEFLRNLSKKQKLTGNVKEKEAFDVGISQMLRSSYKKSDTVTKNIKLKTMSIEPVLGKIVEKTESVRSKIEIDDEQSVDVSASKSKIGLQVLKEDFNYGISKLFNDFEKNIGSRLDALGSKVKKLDDKVKLIKQEKEKSVADVQLEEDTLMSKTWKEIIKLVEVNELNEAFVRILQSGDDLYLLRLICLSEKKLHKLEFKLISQLARRVCLINRSNCVENLTVKVLNSLFETGRMREIGVGELNNMMDELFSITMLDEEIGRRASELYEKVTREIK